MAALVGLPRSPIPEGVESLETMTVDNGTVACVKLSTPTPPCTERTEPTSVRKDGKVC